MRSAAAYVSCFVRSTPPDTCAVKVTSHNSDRQLLLKVTLCVFHTTAHRAWNMVTRDRSHNASQARASMASMLTLLRSQRLCCRFPVRLLRPLRGRMRCAHPSANSCKTSAPVVS